MLAFVSGVGVVAGVAFAAVPDSSSGTITACYPRSGASKGALRVIDAQAGAHCAAGEAMLTWPSRGFRWRGSWSGTAAYGVNDVVGYLGSAYIAVAANANGAPPPGSSWELFASAGAPGVGGSCGAFPHVGVDWSMPGSAPGHGCDFTGAVMFQFDLTNANLTNANFTDASFAGVVLTGANVTGANLSIMPGGPYTSVVSGGLIGTPAVLGPDWMVRAGYLIGPRADLTNANLAGQNLRGANLFVAPINGADLSGANLTKAYMFDVIANDARVNLSHANLTRANIDGASLEHANLAGANLTGANASNADLTGADMAGAIVTRVTWNNTQCPDGQNSVYFHNTCVGHLTPKK